MHQFLQKLDKLFDCDFLFLYKSFWRKKYGVIDIVTHLIKSNLSII